MPVKEICATVLAESENEGLAARFGRKVQRNRRSRQNVDDAGGLGYEGGALIFAVGLAFLASLYFWTSVSRVLLFWAAFILTRPLGVTLDDFLDKPTGQGGGHRVRRHSFFETAPAALEA